MPGLCLITCMSNLIGIKGPVWTGPCLSLRGILTLEGNDTDFGIIDYDTLMLYTAAKRVKKARVSMARYRVARKTGMALSKFDIPQFVGQREGSECKCV